MAHITMFTMSRLSDYGTVLLITMAADPAVLYSAAQLAFKTKLPYPTVSKLLKLLLDSSLVSSTRGVKGGYQIRHLADQIRLSDIVAAIDGPLEMALCGQGATGCVRDDQCLLKHNWQILYKFWISQLGKIRLSDLSRPLTNQFLLEKVLEQPLVMQGSME